MSVHVQGRKRFKLDKQLGAGAFGEIYSALDTDSGDLVAVKLERVDAEYPQLIYEARVYKKLQSKRGIPRLHYVGQEQNYNVLVMERLGHNLETLFNQCRRRFSLRTVLLLADKMLALIKTIHTEGFIHRDIKPDNFVIGTAGHETDIYMIDFGLSKCFVNPETREHIGFRRDKHLTGTARYASVNNHQGVEQSRRDDLESLGYVLIYFLKGALPWQNMKLQGTEHQKYRSIMQMKINSIHTSSSLVADLPDAFFKYFAYVRELTFEQEPNYKFLRRLFYDCYMSSVAPTTTTTSTGTSTDSGNTDSGNTDEGAGPQSSSSSSDPHKLFDWQ